MYCEPLPLLPAVAKEGGGGGGVKIIFTINFDHIWYGGGGSVERKMSPRGRENIKLFIAPQCNFSMIFRGMATSTKPW